MKQQQEVLNEVETLVKSIFYFWLNKIRTRWWCWKASSSPSCNK